MHHWRPDVGGLGAGRATFPQARVIAEAIEPLDAGAAAAVQARVLPRVHTQTRAQLRAAVARAVIAVDPLAAEARHGEAMTRRAVRAWAEPESMATLSAYGRLSLSSSLCKTCS